MKIFAFRFDIDHEKGLREGVPRILELRRKYDMKFTFFVNMGKVFDLKEFILKKRNENVKKIPIRKKLGNLNALKTILLNPNVGLNNKKILLQIKKEGHELALHGGMNHMKWQRGLNKMGADELEKSFFKAYDSFEKLFGKPKGFGSPGFKNDDRILDLIDKYGIKYGGDVFNDKPFYPKYKEKIYKHIQIPVTVKGDPFSIPLIEYLYSSKKNKKEIIDILKKEIKRKDLAILYGHPVFEGLQVEILDELFKFIKAEKYKIMTLNEIADYYKKVVK